MPKRTRERKTRPSQENKEIIKITAKIDELETKNKRNQTKIWFF